MKFDTRDKKPKLWNIAAVTAVFAALLAVLVWLGAEKYAVAASIGFDLYYLIVLFLLVSAFFKQIGSTGWNHNF